MINMKFENLNFDGKRTFGVEVEFISSESQRETVERINQYLESNGIDLVVSTASWNDCSNGWRIKTDSSVSGRVDGSWGEGLELVTPVLRGTEDLKNLIHVLDAINSIAIHVNRTCGLHVHIGVDDWKVSNFRNLVKRYAKFESALDSIQPVSRRRDNGSYCQSNFTEFDSTNLKSIFKDIDSRKRRISNSTFFNRNRYVKLNLDSFAKHTTVEFRHHAGTTNTDKIVNWLKVCMAMVECADARRSVRVKDTDSVDSNDNTLRVFFNGLSSVSNLITEDVRRFYTRRQKELGTYVRS
jgi:hypothetical protein